MPRDLRLRLSKEELRRLYISEKKSLEDIARLYGSSRVAVWKYCKSERITRRGRSDARLEAQKKGKVPQSYFDINENFFSKWSPEMAYVLGLIATDGCVSKTGTVSLCINDKDLLERVKDVMSSAHTIKYYGHQEGLYSFNFARQKLCADLNRLGIFPNKSLNIRFPDVPDAFLIDFIRGVFDGDGSVFFEKRSPKCPLRTSFVSASKQFITALEFKLRALGMPQKNIWQQSSKNSFSFILRYAHKDSIKLFKILYQNMPEKSIFLMRKYECFLQGIKQSEDDQPRIAGPTN